MTGRVSTVRVARQGHPFLLAAAVSGAVLALMLLSIDAQATATSGYRLAGIVAVGKDYLGFLELPGGEQVLVRQGSTINGGGRIVALDGERLRIAFPDGTVELMLEGSGRPGAATATTDAVLSQADEGHTLVRNVDSATLRQALVSSHASDKRADAGIEVGRRFAGLVNLPNNARVLAVNEVPVTSADAAIRLAEKSLAEGTPVRLNLAAPSGDPDTRVYLLPTAR